ncbi:MAG: hypothetical protein J1F65_05910 [Clostridiales bacterium]|nr:hypothetical protein [Clostridiales bacterium]
MGQPVHKRWWIWVIIVLVVVIVITICFSDGSSSDGIKIVEEKLVTTGLQVVKGNYIFPIVSIRVKNTSSVAKNVSFEVNFYANGELLSSDQAEYITLAPGDEATLMAQSSYGIFIGTQTQYTYKITKWWIY